VTNVQEWAPSNALHDGVNNRKEVEGYCSETKHPTVKKLNAAAYVLLSALVVMYVSGVFFHRAKLCSVDVNGS
jgi:hypothetical protein